MRHRPSDVIEVSIRPFRHYEGTLNRDQQRVSYMLKAENSYAQVVCGACISNGI